MTTSIGNTVVMAIRIGQADKNEVNPPGVGLRRTAYVA